MITFVIQNAQKLAFIAFAQVQMSVRVYLATLLAKKAIFVSLYVKKNVNTDLALLQIRVLVIKVIKQTPKIRVNAYTHAL